MTELEAKETVGLLSHPPLSENEAESDKSSVGEASVHQETEINEIQPKERMSLSSWTIGLQLRNKKKVLILSHPEPHNNTFCYKASTLVEELRLLSVAETEDTKFSSLRQNWMEFADKSLYTYDAVVIVLSDGMNKLCNCDNILNEGSLLLERCGEYIPVLVLGKLRQNHQPSIHLISLNSDLEEGETLIKDFLNHHEYLTERKTQLSQYVLHGPSISTPDTKPILDDFLDKFRKNLS